VNSEQIKIIAVMVGTLLFAIVVDSMVSGSSAGNKLASTPVKSSKSSYKSSKPSCRKKGHNLYGKVKFVDSFPDLTIEYVSSFPDINVQFVSSFPSSCGQWQKVDSFPDFTVQVVSSFGDLKVKKVSSFPGME
jgi:hypothetical protein